MHKKNARMLQWSGSTLKTIHSKFILKINPSPARGSMLPGAACQGSTAIPHPTARACPLETAYSQYQQQAAALDYLRVQIFDY